MRIQFTAGMSAGTAVAATGGVAAGALSLYERTYYKYNNQEKNNADYQCSHIIMTPISYCHPELVSGSIIIDAETSSA